MPRRGEMTTEFGGASFDKDLKLPMSLLIGDWVIQSLLDLFKYYPRLITQYRQCGCKYI